MTYRIQWSIGKEGTTGTRLDQPPFRAFFYWFEGDNVVKSADYAKADLVDEIARRRASGEDIEPFQEALGALR